MAEKKQVTLETVESTTVKTDCMHKRGLQNKGWRRRMFVLTNNSLYYFPPRSSAQTKSKGSIEPLTNFKVQGSKDDHANKIFEFKLVPKDNIGRIYEIYASTPEQKEDWMSVLSLVCEGRVVSKELLEMQKNGDFKDFKINEEEIEIIEDSLLGKNSSSIVKKGRWLKVTDVAVKMLDLKSDSESTKSLFKEIQLLAQLRHPNIVAMYGYCIKDDQICLITEYVSGGNLYDAVERWGQKLGGLLIIRICLSICRGMVFLHSKGVIHSALKPSNILVQNLEAADLKVSDFGISMKSDKPVTSRSHYEAPELKGNTSGVTNKIDVFSFGLLLWELCTGTRCPEDDIERDKRPTLPNSRLSGLIEKCWARSAHERPSFEAIYEQLQKLEEVEEAALLAAKFASMTPEEAILSGFNGRETLPWNQFAKLVNDVLSTTGAEIKCIARLKYVLSKDNIVYKSTWESVMKWFSPLVVIDAAYQNSKASTEVARKPSNPSDKGWDIEEIVGILGEPWFFGFITSDEAVNILKTHKEFTCLVRFSKEPNYFAISVFRNASCGHWRVELRRANRATPPTYYIEGIKFSSLNEILFTYRNIPLPCDPAKGEYFLKFPLDRETREAILN